MLKTQLPLEEILKIIGNLQQAVDRQKSRSMARFFDSGSHQDMVEAHRAIGAADGLAELVRRFRRLDPETPDWVLPHLQDHDPEFRLQPRRNELEVPDFSAGRTTRRRRL